MSDMIKHVLEAEKAGEERIEKTKNDLAKKLDKEIKSLEQKETDAIAKLKEAQAQEIQDLVKKLETQFSRKRAKTQKQIDEYEKIGDKEIAAVAKHVVKILNDGD